MEKGFKPFDITVDGKHYGIRYEGKGNCITNMLFDSNNPDLAVYIESEMFVCWGIMYDPKNVMCKDILGKDCVTLEEYVTITRNGEDFYRFSGDINTGINKARAIISELKKHPFKFEHFNYVNNNIMGRSVKYKNNDWIVTGWLQSDLEVTIRNIDLGCITISIFDKDAVF